MGHKAGYDLLIIGGGINGCGIAADAAMRGLSVCLIEKGDIASQTSSSSSKLIHGGLRYLEQFNFNLVKKALDERSVLSTIAPHLVKPLPFIIPYNKSMRPKWLIRLGLFLYDHLSRQNQFPRSQYLTRISTQANNDNKAYFKPLNKTIKTSFSYFDAQTNDARLTIVNAQQASKYGAHILPRHSLLSAQRLDADLGWLANVSHENTHHQIKAKTIINATGPWVNQTNELIGIESAHKINWVKGSHLVVNKLYEGNHAYLLQNNDKRIIFVTPFDRYTMIGTTDVPMASIDEPCEISQTEMDYLLALTNQYFSQSIGQNGIIHSWSGIRPLIESGDAAAQNMSRGYLLQLDDKTGSVLSVYGGKITTYRQLAKKALSALAHKFPTMGPCKTSTTPLPGGNIPPHKWKHFYQAKTKQYHWLDNNLLERLINTYSSDIDLVLKHCEQAGDLGEDFGCGLFETEIRYLIQFEWAQTCEDILWRRTNLGLQAESDTIHAINNYLKTYPPPTAHNKS